MELNREQQKTNRMRIMRCIIIISDIKYRMNIRWINYLSHLLNLLLLCGYTSSQEVVSHTTLSIVQHSKATLLTSISSNDDNVTNFMTSNFTARIFSNGNRAVIPNNKISNDDDEKRHSTYQAPNFNNEKSNKIDDRLSVNESDVDSRDKRGGPKRVRQEKIFKDKTRVNSTSSPNDIGNSLIHDDFSFITNHINRVSRAPQNAKRKNLKNVTTNSADSDVTKPIKVSLLGLFELTSRKGLRMEGRSELAAAELAVRHINEREFLEGYTLELMTNDTQVCDVL